MLAIANQKPGVLERYGMSRADGERTAWTVDAEGRRLEGAAAISRVLIALGGGWGVVGAFYEAPPLKFACDALYSWFAPRRARFRHFGTTPECDEPDAGCQ